MVRIVEGGNPLVLSKIFYNNESESDSELNVENLSPLASPVILRSLRSLHLIQLNYAESGLDLMVGQWIDRNYVIYLGHWNDGVIQNEI